jgi:hypothetical protein
MESSGGHFVLAGFSGERRFRCHQLRIGLSIGVAIFPADGADAVMLQGNAGCRALPQQGRRERIGPRVYRTR